jgi:hypothetical protein
MSGMLQIDVCGLGGFICKFSIRDSSTVAEIKETIQKITQMQVDEQQLIRGTEQLEDATALVSCSERNLSLTLLRRSPEETEWIGRLRRGWGLKAVPAYLKTHRSIALAAVHTFSHAVRYLPVELKDDPEVLIIKPRRESCKNLQAAKVRASGSASSDYCWIVKGLSSHFLKPRPKVGSNNAGLAGHVGFTFRAVAGSTLHHLGSSSLG